MNKQKVTPNFSDIVQLVRQHYKEAFDVDMGYAEAAQVVDEAILPQKREYANSILDDIYEHIPSSHTIIHTDRGHEAYQKFVSFVAEYGKGASNV